jgi:CheY-like chemotaxis protein
MSQHLLMIEDDARLAAMVAQYLEQSGYTVSCAGDGRQRLACAEQPCQGCPADLVILDLMLPDMDGLDVCRRIRTIAFRPGPGASADADRQGRRHGPHHRPGNWRRRLPAQAF